MKKRQKMFGEYPKFVKFLDKGIKLGPNFCFEYQSSGNYIKCYGGWGIATKIVDGKIYSHATYYNVQHLDGLEFVACTEEELELEREYL